MQSVNIANNVFLYINTMVYRQSLFWQPCNCDICYIVDMFTYEEAAAIHQEGCSISTRSLIVLAAIDQKCQGGLQRKHARAAFFRLQK